MSSERAIDLVKARCPTGPVAAAHRVWAGVIDAVLDGAHDLREQGHVEHFEDLQRIAQTVDERGEVRLSAIESATLARTRPNPTVKL